MGNFVKLARVEDIPAGQGKQIDIGEQAIALFNVDGNFYAIEAWCYHMGGPLADGYLRGTRLQCPWHGWTFELTTGCYTRDPNKKLTVFPLKIENGDILVEL